MRTTTPPNTHWGEPWSIIQPNTSGPMMPPMLNPVETMPNTRPIAPGGAARRTSMSREGCIMPKMTPESPIASTSSGRRRAEATDARALAGGREQDCGGGEPDASRERQCRLEVAVGGQAEQDRRRHGSSRKAGERVHREGPADPVLGDAVGQHGIV